MATRLPDNSIQLSNGKVVYADTPILGEDLGELMALLAPPQHFVAFTGRGGGGSGAGGGPGGGGGGSGAGQRGPAGAAGPAGADGAQGNQGSGGNQGNQGNQGPAAGGGGVEIASGVYTGNSESGAESQNITTGLTNNIKFLVVFSIGPNSVVTAPYMFVMSDNPVGTSAFNQTSGFGSSTAITLNGPDFTVQGNANLDSGGPGSYQWFAIG